MRSRRRVVVALLLVAVMGCATVAPRTRVLAPLGPGVERALYVTTTDEREATLSSLRLAGFEIVSDARGAPAVLEVRLGSSRGRKSCGAMRNAVYRLSRAGVLVAELKGRGWTGSCSPGIFGQMAAELSRLFEAPV